MTLPTLRIGRKIVAITATLYADIVRATESMPSEKGRVHPDLHGLRKIGLLCQGEWGIREVPVSVAYQVWHAVLAIGDRLAERFRLHADVAEFFGVDSWRMADAELIGAAASLPRMRAYRTLVEGKFDPTDYQAVYDLVMQATGDEQQALAARADAMRALIQREKK
jgi:hypothetical protein